NRRLIDVWKSYEPVFASLIQLTVEEDVDLRPSAQDHGLLVDLVEGADDDALRAELRDHLDGARARMARAVQALNDAKDSAEVSWPPRPRRLQSRPALAEKLADLVSGDTQVSVAPRACLFSRSPPWLSTGSPWWCRRCAERFSRSPTGTACLRPMTSLVSTISCASSPRRVRSVR